MEQVLPAAAGTLLLPSNCVRGKQQGVERTNKRVSGHAARLQLTPTPAARCYDHNMHHIPNRNNFRDGAARQRAGHTRREAETREAARLADTVIHQLNPRAKTLCPIYKAP
ncbi:hypothetical protein JTE90_025181 [Oedothorax gibbosus]|uniref:Uncharacterized protein n=1 Tax=Oedothorax gibbosus TaxID=931172 RepID=A0AAV6TJA6_9ARAC|nr:hypothetical protein JTE90_025181 [Oedothorax gibbosus]